MKVWLDLGDAQAELGNKGITLHIADNSGTKVCRRRSPRDVDATAG